MLILPNTGNIEGLNLKNLAINFRLPSALEKDNFYNTLLRKKADSFFDPHDSIKDNFLVIDYGENENLDDLLKISDNDERIKAINAFTGRKKNIINRLYFLFASCDIIEGTTFFAYESKIRVLDLSELDSGVYNRLVSEIIIEKFLYKEKLGVTLYNIDALRIFLVNFDNIYTELKHLYRDEYFQYIGELLFHYIQTDSMMMKFSILSSIMEFFLIHGKEKITEQFIFKGMIIKDRLKLSYFNYEVYDLKLFSPNYSIDAQDLKQIYDLRSKIVHGDFSKINVLSNGFKSVFTKLQFFTSCVLHQYLLNPDYILAIKNNG